MPKPSYRDDSGAINFLPTSEEKSQLQIRREIKQLQENLIFKGKFKYFSFIHFKIMKASNKI